MGKLFRTPEGFLDLTGQQVGGRYPQDVADALAPTLELFPLVAARLIASEVAPSLTSAYLDSVTIEVPENETWLLFSCALNHTPAATGNEIRTEAYLTNLPGSSDPVNQITILAGDTDQMASGYQATHTNGKQAYYATPIALPAGVQIVGRVIDRNLSTIPWNLQVGFYRLSGN